ncbi:hypothetical protein BH23VER1_BH23VER1_25860 [soil metagenome]
MPDLSDPLATLDQILSDFGCVTGTLHRFDSGTQLLILLAQRGIPDALMDKVAKIPIGKGIAGAAAERREAVQLCNLQTDTSGVARPDAKQTQVSGSLAVPIIGDDDALLGVIGIGKREPYEFTDAESKRLWQAAENLAENLTP